MIGKQSELYHAGATTICHNERPSHAQQFIDYVGFLAMNGLVELLELHRRVRDFMHSDLGLGVIFGATATVCLFILSGAGW